MADFATIIFLLSQLLVFFESSSSLPLCTDLRAPSISKAHLAFCPYNGSVCCDSTKDIKLRKQFQAMKISDSSCAAILKSILCATCDPFSAELFDVQSEQRPIPFLCNSTGSSSSHSSKQVQVTQSFCSTVWNTCKNVPILNSPFAPLLQGRAGAPIVSNSSTLVELWQTENSFCDVFGGSSKDKSICFDGKPVSLNKTESIVPPKGLCLEKIGSGSYINMVAHPDGSNRAFFSNQPGKIWLATIPEQDSGAALELDESEPFSDLTDQVFLDTQFGMMGLAFHPNYTENGRFFASYNCDQLKSPACSGRCSCNSDVNCDPSKLNTTSQPCQYQSVIAEFSANGTAPNLSLATAAKPLEVRRIFTMGLPFTNDHGGQILFGPADGYLYVMMGDGGGQDDPYNFAQNKKSILGKILRLDVDNMPTQEEISQLGLWGNYTIPRDNPYAEDKELEPEIWAMGFRNPWRCSFDAERPSYFVCADVGQDRYEEVDLVTKGGNYGWEIYEGPILSNPQQLSKENRSANSPNLIFPALGYSHADINKKVGSAAISGGFFYRSKTDPCMYGSYLYGDLYASNIWAAVENPIDSGNFSTTELPFSCAHDSPLQCSSVPDSTLPALGYIFSFGQDNRKDVFILASNGVYRVVRPSRCNYTCPEEKFMTPAGNPSPSPSTPSSAGQSVNHLQHFFLILLTMLVLRCLYATA
ncbi:hipl1 protein [Ancistrocladus abbreviatus]